MPLDDTDKTWIADQIKTGLTEGLKPLGGRLEKLEGAPPPDVDAIVAKALEAARPQAKEDDAPANGGDGEAQARLAALEAELKAQKRAAKDADEARAQEKMLGALRTQLLAAGVPPTRVDHAIAHLHHAQGRIGLSDDGQAVIRFDRESAGGKYQDHLGLDAGLAEWLDTDDGRAFLPPARVAGKDDHNSGRQPFITKGPSGQTQVNTKGLISKVLDRAARG